MVSALTPPIPIGLQGNGRGGIVNRSAAAIYPGLEMLSNTGLMNA
jgi:hypothetical protein